MGRLGKWDGPLVVHAERTDGALPPAECVRLAESTANGAATMRGNAGNGGAGARGTAPSVFNMPPGSVVDTRLAITGVSRALAVPPDDYNECGRGTEAQ